VIIILRNFSRISQTKVDLTRLNIVIDNNYITKIIKLKMPTNDVQRKKTLKAYNRVIFDMHLIHRSFQRINQKNYERRAARERRTKMINKKCSSVGGREVVSFIALISNHGRASYTWWVVLKVQPIALPKIIFIFL